MLGKVLSVVMGTGTANNPWKPKNQEQFDTMVADKDKVGNYIEYLGKTYRVEKEKLVGNFRVGQEITKLYFDTTKNPYKNFGDSDFDVTGLTLATDAYGREMSPAKVKYLAVTDETTTFTDALKKKFSLRKGLFIISVGNGQQYLYLSDDIIYMNALGVQQWVPFDNDDNSYPLDPPLVPTYVAPQMANNYWSTTDAGYVFTTLEPQFAQPYYPLKELSDAATRDDIKRGKKAYNSNGLILTGTHDEPENPWTPATEAEYRALIVPEHIGNFFDYENKITRLESISYSGTFAVGDSITSVYFDTTKTPTIPDFTSGYEEFDTMKLKYLFKTSGTIEDSVPYCGLFWYEAPEGADTAHALLYAAGDGVLRYVWAEGDGWTLTHNEGGLSNGFILGSAETITEVVPDSDWNGVYAFKNYVISMPRYIEVPALTNEGTAADLATGKQLINSQGEVVTGTGTIVPTPGPEPETGYFVKVIDYDGTELLSAQGENGNSFTLPPAPSHDGLVFQEWSASCPITNGTVTIDNNNIMVGAVYTTASGLNEFDIELTEDFGLSVSLKIDGEKDWGDGTTDSETTHTYAAYGNYTIKCGGTDLGEFVYAMPCTFARLATVTTIDYRAFNGCGNLEKIIFSKSVRNINGETFEYCNNLGSIIIPNTITTIGGDTFRYCVGLKHVVIPNSVTSIGSYAFAGCDKLTDIAIPAGVKSLSYAFERCDGLIDVIVPEGIERIEYAFSSCKNLTSIKLPTSAKIVKGFDNCGKLMSVVIPNNATAIGNFDRCYNLTNITIPNSVTSIGSFDGCYNLTSITIPEGVTSLKFAAFRDCSNLTSITIPDSVTSLGTYAFCNCSGLTSITIPDNVTSISDSAFSGCDNLTSITIPEGVTSIKDSTFAHCYNLTNITIPNSVTSIGSYAFSYCNNLTSITIPDGVTNIVRYTFLNCHGLTSVAIGNNVTEIGAYAFDDCYGLTNIIIPAGLTKIGDNAFARNEHIQNIYIADMLAWCNISGLSGLMDHGSSHKLFLNNELITSLVVPDGITTIVMSCFRKCDKFLSVAIPSSVTRIEFNAFEGCKNIEDIYITDVAAWCNMSGVGQLPACNSKSKRLFLGNELITALVIPENVTSIQKNTFSYFSNLANIKIPDSVTGIESYAFDHCSGLTNITIPNSVTSIGDYAFNYCSGLKSVTIPNNVTSINEGTFYCCTGLQNVTIPENITSIAYLAFYRCSSLTNIIIPDSVTSMGVSAFLECSSLTSAIIGNNVQNIPAWAFQHCSSLTSLIIGSGVTNITTWAFDGCSSLADITLLPTTPPSLRNEAFRGIPDTAVFTVPKGTLDAYKTASGWSVYANKMVEAAN